MIRIQNFIGGILHDSVSGATIDSFCPATGKVHATMPDSDEKDVDDAVKAAKNAFKTWSKTAPEDRSAVLNRIADILEAKLEEFARAESKDQGKPVSLARTVDIPRAVHNFRFFANLILYETTTSSQQPKMGTLNYTVKLPVGVAGLISPWNLPLYLLTWKIAPALAYGNTCVCKPSEFTSVTAWMLCEVMNEAKLPPGVCNMIFGLGGKAGNALVSHPDVPLISFTGGTVTGEKIIKSSAPHYKKLSLELGGKNPGIVFEDANINKCIATLTRAGFANQGEICLCSSRLFVHENVYDEFVSKYVEEVKKIKVGDPSHEDTVMGALVSKDHLAKVMSYVNLAKDLGGEIKCGGETLKLGGDLNDGYFMSPTVITGLGFDSAVCQEEIFGPVVTITKFQTEEQVIEWANSVKYGLAASIWTENLSKMHRVAQEIHAGTVWCNCWMIRDLRMPFGGMKASGVGREGMDHSSEFFTEEKTICIKYN